MEHLLLPRGAVLSLNERAQYIAEPYHGPFLTYPQRSRFKTLKETLLPEGDVPRSTVKLSEQEIHDLEVFLQTWLVFGLLHEVFGDKAYAARFIREEDGQAFVDTSELSNLAEEWVVQHYHLGERGKELLEHLLKCIWETHRMLAVLRKRHDINLTSPWTISSIGETLEELVLETLEKGTRVQPTTWNWYNTDATAQLMIEHNWCPADVKTWRKHWLGFQTMFYMSKIEQPRIKDHSKCEGENCIANQYDLTRHRTVHRCAGEDCGSVAVDVDAVTAILADGHIALLDITIDDAQQVEIEVVSSKDHDTYIALSHVWADGLGNPFDNALPRCQLTYVARVIQELATEAGQEKVLLWLDTLCCPVASLPHRMLCITRMRQIYEAATYVLVLDAALAHYNSFELDCVEVSARMMYSSWTRRLWTLQEGALGRNLWVQLKDKAVDMDAVSAELKQRFQTKFIHSPLLTQVYSSLHRLRHTVNPTIEKPSTNLVQLHSAVQFRSVSVASDEPLCLATFLNLDQTAIVQTVPEERMKAFWQAFSTSEHNLPKSIVFFAGPRMIIPGFRWSPATLLGPVNMFNLRNPRNFDEVGKVHDHGLRADFPAFEIIVSSAYSEEDALVWHDIFKDVSPVCYARRDADSWYMLLLEGSPLKTNGLTIMDVLHRNGGHNTIIMESDLDKPSATNSTNDVCTALAVSVPDQDYIVHAEETLHIVKLPVNQALVSETTWQMSQDETLRSLLRPFVRDKEEVPVRPDDEAFDRIPNAAMSRLQELVSTAVTNSALMACLEGTVEKKLDALMARTLFCFAGSYALIERSWPSSQVWFID